MTPAESHYVLQSLVSQGRIRKNQVKAVLKGRVKEIASLRERLAALVGMPGGRSRRGGRTAATGAAGSRFRRRSGLFGGSRASTWAMSGG
jgi:hypothetical protein